LSELSTDGWWCPYSPDDREIVKSAGAGDRLWFTAGKAGDRHFYFSPAALQPRSSNIDPAVLLISVLNSTWPNL
jgi:hypothetical protein